MTQSRIDILVNARNNASPALKQVGTDLRSVDNAASTLSRGLSGLAAGAGVAGIAALGTAAVTSAFELGQLGAQALMVESAFDSMAERAGSSSDAMLSAMRDASRGMISETELMLGANRAVILGVADNVNEMGALLEVAGARAKAMGLDTATAFNDIVVGIGRMSPLAD